MNRLFKVVSLSLLAAVLALYLGDAAVFAVRKHNGTAFRVIEVNTLLTTPLKGNKEEYDVAGSESVTCARTIFPQPGFPACWWLARHTAQWQ